MLFRSKSKAKVSSDSQPKVSSDSQPADEVVTFQTFHPRFASITGQAPRADLLAHSRNGEKLFHEACIYHAASRSVFVTSNQLKTAKEPPYHKTIALYRIYVPIEDPTQPAKVEPVTFPGIEGAFLNGGVNYTDDSILLCAQGSLSEDDPNGIIQVTIPTSSGEPTSASYSPPTTVVSKFHGLPFNSVNDVIVNPIDSSIWFTDPCYGYHQTIRAKPVLPNQVYRFDTTTGSIRCVADGFVRPNGLCFSPDLKVLYVTDTGGVHGSSEVEFDHAGPSHIYAFDITYPSSTTSSGTASDAPAKPAYLPLASTPERSTASSAAPQPFLTNRRLFAFAPGRCPDGIKTDTRGNVYSGCLDGIWVWSPDGEAQGVIQVPGGVANFCFGEAGIIYACNETRFWKIRLDDEHGLKGALLGL